MYDGYRQCRRMSIRSVNGILPAIVEAGAERSSCASWGGVSMLEGAADRRG
ncbi:MAG: hypothetical protein JWN03_845 [Nocardia sp.]|nr:hypothetical protein [Nocardia sp.]